MAKVILVPFLFFGCLRRDDAGHDEKMDSVEQIM